MIVIDSQEHVSYIEKDIVHTETYQQNFQMGNLTTESNVNKVQTRSDRVLSSRRLDLNVNVDCRTI